MTDDFITLVQNDLNAAKELINRLVSENLKHDEDLFKYDICDYKQHISRIADEITTAYAMLGHYKKEEELANASVKRAEAQSYMTILEATPKGAKQPTAETLKRQCLCTDKLKQYYERAGEALKNRVIQEGIIEALKTKREFLKTLAIEQNKIERNERYI